MKERIKVRDGEKELEVLVSFSERKTLGITVTPELEVNVRAPNGIEHERLVQALNRRLPWIKKQISAFSDIQILNEVPEYQSGQTIRYLGRDYMLRINEVAQFEEERTILEHKILRVDIHDRTQIVRASLMIEEWYKTEALVYLSEKFEQLYPRVKKHGVERPQYFLRKMKRKWGACTPSGVIYLNPELIKLPSHCIEYVIVHELCHLKFSNHSKDYYYFLDTVMPDWKPREADLLNYENRN